MKHRVKKNTNVFTLIFKYSDVAHVEADNEKEAVEKAIKECQEEYECFYDAEVTEDDQ